MQGINDRWVFSAVALSSAELELTCCSLSFHLVAPSSYSLDAVEDLMKSNDFSTTFDAMAKKLPDLERMLSRIHAKSCKKQEL